VLGTDDPDLMRTHLEARRENTEEDARQRADLRKALELKDYEFNGHGVELGQRYASGAVAPDGTAEPVHTRDPALYYHPTTWPGARLPHVWLGRNGRRVPTHDLAGKGRFCLLTGISGEAWAEAADKVAAELSVEIAPYVRAGSTSTCTRTGHGRGRSARTAACSCARTCTWCGGPPGPSTTRRPHCAAS
jgi:2,4-dichlorophenol 6-monooxygenase